VINSLAVLACTHAVGADIVKAAKSLAKLTPPQKRGERFDVEIPGGTVTVIDESYNASPAAMRAALAVLAAQPTPADGRRIAVLGDMLELGDDTPKQHADLAEVLIASEIDIVYLAGPAMHHLWTALPASLQGHHCATSKDLAPVLNAAVQPGDVVMVKGSAGINMGHIVETLRSLQTSPRKGED
jgi:UDP-N-acetylmuramoyl-tripeptide--D-alanyl-D-alanine ligase